MTGWFQTVLTSRPETTPLALGGRVVVALCLGLAVAGIYRWARRGESIPTTFLTTLVLLAVVIALATQIIGDNVARAFSLVGALSVVRFRTVVKDTQDTAFVILAVVVGMSAGADHLVVGLVGLAVLVAAAPLLWPPGRRDPWLRTDATLSLRLGQSDGSQAAVEDLLARSTTRFDLVGAETARKGAALDLVYHVRLRPGESPTGLIAGLTPLGGVESISLNRRD